MATILMKSVMNSAVLTFMVFATVAARYERHELPVSNGLECDRDCDVDSFPRTCVYHFVLEQYTTMGGACDYCTPNCTNHLVNDCTCVLTDGVERSILTANRMIPGPAIFACQGDEIIVYVKNHLEGSETTIHWHGLHQEGTPYSDGVPFVTQCPILYGNTFRYKFWAAQSGTFFWHSHSGLQKYNGLSGSLVIKGKRSLEPNCHLYDHDLREHVIFIQDWLDRRAEEVFPGNYYRRPSQVPTNILVNGLGKAYFNGSRTEVPFATFEVEPEFRYRFRLINAFASVCPAAITIENHNFTLIATDGFAVKPVPATTITSMTGERYDFSLTANQTIGCYWMQILGLGECANITQLAVLKYHGASCDVPSTPEPTYVNPLPSGIIINPVNATYNDRVPNSVPLTHLENTLDDNEILSLTPSRTFYIPFSIYEIENTQEFFEVNNYNHFLVNEQRHFVGVINNISHTQPNAPLLSQPKDVYMHNICNYTTCLDELCHCTNIHKLKYGEVVDFFFIDTVNNTDLYHPFHVHGMYCHILGMGYARDLNLTKISRQGVYDAFNGVKFPMHKHRSNESFYPIVKDTIAIPTNGYAHVRVIAKNPGPWFVHCHVDVHMSVGMSMVIQVAEPCDFPPVPRHFPKCNDFLG